MARLFPEMDELGQKLRSTRQQKLPSIEMNAVDVVDLRELDHRRNEFEQRHHDLEHGEAYYPGFKKDLRIITDPIYGRKVKTNEELLIGEIALIAEPFATVVLNVDINGNEIREPYCLTCHQVDGTFIACENCNLVFFCSEKCKFVNDTHQFECDTIFHEILEEDIKCSIQMVLKMMALFSTYDDLKEAFESLRGNRKIPKRGNDKISIFQCIMLLAEKTFRDDDENEELIECRSNMNLAFNYISSFPTVVEYFDLETAGPGTEMLKYLLAHFITALPINSFGLGLEMNSPQLGKVYRNRLSIYGSVSYINHSCSPNIIHFLNGNILTGIASQPIKRNKPIFLNYLGVGTDVDRRTTYERCRQLGFICDCDRCRNMIEINQSHIKTANKPKINVQKALDNYNDWSPQRGAYIWKYCFYLAKEFDFVIN